MVCFRSVGIEPSQRITACRGYRRELASLRSARFFNFRALMLKRNQILSWRYYSESSRYQKATSTHHQFLLDPSRPLCKGNNRLLLSYTPEPKIRLLIISPPSRAHSAVETLQLLEALPHRDSFLVRESLGLFSGRRGALGRLLRAPLCRFHSAFPFKPESQRRTALPTQPCHLRCVHEFKRIAPVMIADWMRSDTWPPQTQSRSGRELSKQTR